jgi:DNA-binding transcriptional MocR family regulator
MAAYEPSTWPLREDVAKRCLEVGVVLAPGNVFSVSQSAAPPMRFNVAQSGNQRFEDALNQALDHGSSSGGP